VKRGASSMSHDVIDLSAGCAVLPDLDNSHRAHNAAQPMGLWVGEGVGNALAARALLYHLDSHYRGQQWVVLGPAGSACYFEMDSPVAAYIPLLGLSAHRPAQWRLSHWWATRKQQRALRAVGLLMVFGVRPQGHKAWLAVGRNLGCPLHAVSGSLDHFLRLKHPVLQAGPSALAYATHVFRHTLPNQHKEVVFVDLVAGDGLSANMAAAVPELAFQHESAPVKRVVAVLSDLSGLMQRRLAAKHPDWHWVSMAQAFGLLGYADRVVGTHPDITLIGREMAREALFVLDKTHS